MQPLAQPVRRDQEDSVRLLKADSEIEYGLMEETDLREMSAQLAEAFSRYEPQSVAVDLPYGEIEKIVRCFGPKVVREELTVIARAKSSGVLVGAMLTEDFATPPPLGIETAAPRFAPIGALLGGLDDKYLSSRSIVPGEYLHLFMMGVSSAFGGRDIAQNLVTLCVENGRKRGYHTAVTEATGCVSQHVFRKLGFRDVLMERYRDFVFDGQRVFESIPVHEGTILMELVF